MFVAAVVEHGAAKVVTRDQGKKGIRGWRGMNRYGDVPGWRIPTISSHLPIPFAFDVLEIFDTKDCYEKTQN
jgi:hypothetical protein